MSSKQKNEMEIATGWLILTRNGSEVPIRGVTPAELCLLVKDRINHIGKHPIHDLVVADKPVLRTAEEEKERLRQRYGKPKDSKKFKIDELFPGHASTIPTVFEGLAEYEQSLLQVLGKPVPGPDDKAFETPWTFAEEPDTGAKAPVPGETEVAKQESE
jgi:hypothetical protein